MKKSLLKMRVCLGFDCNPRLDVISYDDEVTDNGMVYQSTRGVRSEKTLVKLGQQWMKFDSSSKEPYWDAYVILDASSTEQERGKAVVELYNSAIYGMKNGIGEMRAKFDSLKAPSITDAENAVNEKLSGADLKKVGGVVVSVDEFKRLVGESVKESGKELAKENGFAVEKWDKFCEQTLTPDILTILMKGLPVLKFTGNGISFQTQELYQQALTAVAGKVASDVFGRFYETMNKVATP